MHRIVLIMLVLTGISFADPVATTVDNKTEVKKEVKHIVRQGFALAGVEGEIVREKGMISFKFDKSVTDGEAVIAVGDSIEILTSAARVQIEKNLAKKKSTSVRIWGILTTYGEKNYIYASYFLPLSKAIETEQKETAAETKADPDDVIPQDILSKLRPKSAVNIAEMKKLILKEQDVMIVDRTGFIKLDKKTGTYHFELDAIGRNVDKMSFEILKSQELERLITLQKRSAFKLRFKIAAVATKYGNDYYVLLKRASRAYSQGNFAD